MEVRHENAMNNALDTLMDTGVVQITQDNWRRWYGVTRNGKRTKAAFEQAIMQRIESEGYNEADSSLHIYECYGVWTIIFSDNAHKLQTITEWAGSE